MIDSRKQVNGCRIYVEGTQLIGAGVGLRVLMHGLRHQDLVWFSRTYGLHADNCIVLGVARSESQALDKTINPDRAPIHAALKGDFEIEEYLLTESVQSALGVSIQWQGENKELYTEESRDEELDRVGTRVYISDEFFYYGSPTLEGAKYLYDEELHDEGMKGVSTRVYVHDDCFFNVRPAAGATLRSLIHAILQQHRFYLQQEVNWQPVLDEVLTILTRAPELMLKSDPVNKRLTLTIKSQGVKLLEALFGFRPRYVIDVSSGTARFLSRPSKVRKRYLKAI